MKGRAKSAPGFDSTGYDMASFGGWIPFVFISFAKSCSDAWLLVGVFGVGGNRMAYSGIENVFSRKVGVAGMDIKNSICVFALFEEMKVFGRVDVLLNKFRYDSFNSGVQTSFLTKGRKQLRYGSMCAVDGPSLLAE